MTAGGEKKVGEQEGGYEGGREDKEEGQTYQGDGPVGGVLERRVGELTLVPVVVDPPHGQLPRLVRAQEEGEDTVVDQALRTGGRKGGREGGREGDRKLVREGRRTRHAWQGGREGGKEDIPDRGG